MKPTAAVNRLKHLKPTRKVITTARLEALHDVALDYTADETAAFVTSQEVCLLVEEVLFKRHIVAQLSIYRTTLKLASELKLFTAATVSALGEFIGDELENILTGETTHGKPVLGQDFEFIRPKDR